MSRENPFSPSIKSDLAQAAYFHCVRPGCNQSTHFYDPSKQRQVHFGAASHDAPASPNEGGERSGNNLTPEQIRAYNNGAWLCRNCSTLVDIAQSYFPLGTLPMWQATATEARRRLTFSPVPASHINYSEAVARVQRFLDLTKNFHVQHGPSISIPSRHQMEIIVQKCYHLTPTNEYSALFPHLVNVQLRMASDLVSMRKEITDYSNWHISEGYYRCNTLLLADAQQAQRIKESCAKVLRFAEDYSDARNYLQRFVGTNNFDHSLLYLW